MFDIECLVSVKGELLTAIRDEMYQLFKFTDICLLTDHFSSFRPSHLFGYCNRL